MKADNWLIALCVTAILVGFTLTGCRTIERAARHELERKIVAGVQEQLDVYVERKLLALMRDKLPHGLGGVIVLLAGKMGLDRLRNGKKERQNGNAG